VCVLLTAASLPRCAAHGVGRSRLGRGGGGDAAGTRLLHPLLPGGHAGLYPSIFLAGFRHESVLPCPAFGQTSFSCFAALVVISVVPDSKAVSAALH